MLDPGAGGDAVEAGDHRDLEGGRGLLDQGQVAVRAGVVVVQGQRRRQAVRPTLQQPPNLVGLQGELFFEQRRQYHRGCAGRLQPPQPVQGAGQRRGRGDQRAGQVQAQVAGAQIDHDDALLGPCSGSCVRACLRGVAAARAPRQRTRAGPAWPLALDHGSQPRARAPAAGSARPAPAWRTRVRRRSGRFRQQDRPCRPVGCVNAFMQLVGTRAGDRRAGHAVERGLGDPQR